MKTFGGIEVQLQAFLTKNYKNVSSQVHAPEVFSLGKILPVGPRGGMDTMEKNLLYLPGIESRFIVRLARHYTFWAVLVMV
jgi:hypothetical protein